jgi:hypothetical protein
MIATVTTSSPRWRKPGSACNASSGSIITCRRSWPARAWGAALAYAALAQAPAVTVAGAASDGLATELDIRLPLCPGAPPTPAPMGFEYGLKAELPGWWRIAVLPSQRTQAERFVADIGQAELVGYRDYARRVRFRLIPGLW